LVARELGEVAYYALRERLARTILRDRNEQAVFMSRTLERKRGLEKELVCDRKVDYKDFATAFRRAAKRISAEKEKLRRLGQHSCGVASGWLERGDPHSFHSFAGPGSCRPGELLTTWPTLPQKRLVEI